MPVLQTGRLSLRPPIPADTAFLLGLLITPTVRTYLGGPVPPARQASALGAWLAPISPDIIWLVRTNDTPLGLIFLSRHVDSHLPELSYLFHPTAWGQGYAVEAASRVLRHSEHDLHLTSVVAETQTANHASCRLLQRLGMVEQSRLTRFGAEQAIYLFNGT